MYFFSSLFNNKPPDSEIIRTFNLATGEPITQTDPSKITIVIATPVNPSENCTQLNYLRKAITTNDKNLLQNFDKSIAPSSTATLMNHSSLDSEEKISLRLIIEFLIKNNNLMEAYQSTFENYYNKTEYEKEIIIDKVLSRLCKIGADQGNLCKQLANHIKNLHEQKPELIEKFLKKTQLIIYYHTIPEWLSQNYHSVTELSKVLAEPHRTSIERFNEPQYIHSTLIFFPDVLDLYHLKRSESLLNFLDSLL